jgi:DICT domain-containing protein
MTFSSLIADVKGNERTLTVYDPTDSSAVAAVENHFEVQNVTVEVANAPDGPDDFAVLHDDGTFIAASALEDLRRAVTFESGFLDATDFGERPTPDILKHVSDVTFTSYEKRRMVLASREIEERAWRTGGGQLHAGFQQLSRFREQWDLYARIAAQDVSVHVYGVPDWRPPDCAWLTVHPSEDPEIRDPWFVAYDAPDESNCALLAEETEPNRFVGFWTYDDDRTADVLDHLQSAHA